MYIKRTFYLLDYSALLAAIFLVKNLVGFQSVIRTQYNSLIAYNLLTALETQKGRQGNERAHHVVQTFPMHTLHHM